MTEAADKINEADRELSTRSLPLERGIFQPGRDAERDLLRRIAVRRGGVGEVEVEVESQSSSGLKDVERINARRRLGSRSVAPIAVSTSLDRDRTLRRSGSDVGEYRRRCVRQPVHQCLGWERMLLSLDLRGVSGRNAGSRYLSGTSDGVGRRESGISPSRSYVGSAHCHYHVHRLCPRGAAVAMQHCPAA